MANYPTKPVETTGMPSGIPYIIGNEAAERFCFYGMKTILVVYMTKYLLDSTGGLAPMSEAQAKYWYHFWVSAVYFLPVCGAILADAFLGKYKTIFWLSIVYCVGCFVISLDHTRWGLSIGLALIALGSGGIKPCVSANVGDQFGKANQHLLPKVFGWFYFSINFGSFFSTMLTPVFLDRFGPKVAFGIPGIFMLLATIVFWMGRHRFVRIPPGGMSFVRETFSREGLGTILRLIPIFGVVAIFWSLWDQTGSAWVLQAEKMDREILGYTVLPSQVQAINPILVFTMIPIFSYLIYPLIQKVFPLTPLRKISLGLFLAVPSFLLPALVEAKLGKISTVLVANDLRSDPQLVKAMQDQSQPMSALLQSRFSAETRVLLAAAKNTEPPSQALQQSLLADLNRLVQTNLLYESNLFAKVKLSQDTITRIKRQPAGKELAWLNRTLLSECYPQMIAPLKGPSIWWQVLAFVVISAAEIMISITCLEFAYTQAPPKMKSLLMSVYLLSISIGNAFTSFVNYFIQNPDGTVKLGGSSYYLFFAALMSAAALVFIFVALTYKEKPVALAGQDQPAAN